MSEFRYTAEDYRANAKMLDTSIALTLTGQEKQRLGAMLEQGARMAKHACQIVCAYCGHTPDARWTPEGARRRAEHAFSCEKRPEALLVAELLAAMALLRRGVDEGWSGDDLEAARAIVERWDNAAKRTSEVQSESNETDRAGAADSQ